MRWERELGWGSLSAHCKACVFNLFTFLQRRIRGVVFYAWPPQHTYHNILSRTTWWAYMCDDDCRLDILVLEEILKVIPMCLRKKNVAKWICQSRSIINWNVCMYTIIMVYMNMCNVGRNTFMYHMSIQIIMICLYKCAMGTLREDSSLFSYMWIICFSLYSRHHTMCFRQSWCSQTQCHCVL